MRVFDRYKELTVVAVWMIAVPLVLAFIAGAGAGTIFDGLATFAGTFWSIYGGASLILGVLLLGWTFWAAWRAGELSDADQLNR